MEQVAAGNELLVTRHTRPFVRLVPAKASIATAGKTA
jgi:antitoxin (DNA-binding transcriptional repressor) of toxin-antitoxin stability system